VRNLARLTNAARRLAISNWPTVRAFKRRWEAKDYIAIHREEWNDYDIQKRNELFCVVAIPKEPAQ
jgi:hypothetical protein